MEVREQNRDQQKNGILGSWLPQAMPDSSDTEGHGRRSLKGGFKGWEGVITEDSWQRINT